MRPNSLQSPLAGPQPGAPLIVNLPPEQGDLAPFQTHRLLKGIPADSLHTLVERCKTVDLAAGDVLLSPGLPNHTLYFLLTGQLQVHLDARGSGNSFPILPGEVIGEMSIIENRPVSAWVTAKESCTLLAMPEQVFWRDFVPIPQATRSLLRLLIARVRKTDNVLIKELEGKVRYEHLQRELETAGKIQAGILPCLKPLFPRHPQVEAHAVMRPAREVGGDFFDALAINDHCLAVAVGDVCGKGMPAALFMVRVITLLRVCLLREQDPAAILPAVNRLLCEANEESMFVTLAVAVLDTRTGKLTYLNGGHNPPFLSCRGEPFCLWNPPEGKLLGFDPNAQFDTQEFILSPGDTLVLYTDGVPEATNSHQEMFGVERAARALSQASPHAEITHVVDNLETAVAGFTGSAPQSDDITVLALRHRGSPTEDPVI